MGEEPDHFSLQTKLSVADGKASQSNFQETDLMYIDALDVSETCPNNILQAQAKH